MYGVYYDYDGYDKQVMAVCNTIIECKKLIWEESQDYSIRGFKAYKKMFTEYNYSIHKVEINKWWGL